MNSALPRTAEAPPGRAAAQADSISERLAAFTAALTLAEVPAEVLLRAKHLILDGIGCAFAAGGEPFAREIAGSIARLAGRGERRVIGMNLRLPMRDAALANGMLLHGLDYDDTHAAGIVHLTASLFPAALARAAESGASGAELLLACLAGIEAGARLASVVKGGFHQVGFHPTSLVGTFACSLAAGRIRGLSPARLAAAQGIALSFAAGSLQFVEDGSWTKRVHPGWSAVCGLTAAELAAGEFPAPREAYEGRFGLYRIHLPPAAFERCELDVATRDLGRVWETMNVAVKPFPACHFVHACSDAAIALHREGVDPDRVRSILALVPAGVVEAVCEPVQAKRRPKSDYDAKFSIPYAVASGLARGRVGLAELRPEALVEPRIERIMDKVEYAVDPAAEFPRYYGGEVRVVMDDGRSFTHRVAVNRGHPERPLANAEIEAKYLENASLALDPAAAARLRDLVLGLELLPAAERLEAELGATEGALR